MNPEVGMFYPEKYRRKSFSKVSYDIKIGRKALKNEQAGLFDDFMRFGKLAKPQEEKMHALWQELQKKLPEQLEDSED